MRDILNLILDLFAWLYERTRNLLLAVVNKFLEINPFEKVIVGATIFAFLSVVLPVGEYIIFDSVFTINNPIAHYMIGITLVMIATVYFPGIVAMVARIALNLLYVIYIVYLHSTGGISKAPYTLAAGYYFNIVTSVVYITCAFLSGLLYRDGR
jgi:hypothetical protein